MRIHPPHHIVLALAAAICALPGQAVAQPAPDGGERLVSARFDRKEKDALGFEWSVNEQGALVGGPQGAFEAAGQLQINDNQFFPQRRMMTADGGQFVFTATLSIHQPGMSSRIEVTRRVRIDPKSSTARFVDSYRNLGAGAATLMVNVSASFQNPPASILTDAGAAPAVAAAPQMPGANPFEKQPGEGPGATLDKRESGLVISPAAADAPAVLLYLASPKSKVKPIFLGAGGGVACNYTFSVPPQQTVSILHGVAQRKLGGTTEPRSLARLFKPFKSRAWIADLPDDLKKSLLNFGAASAEDEDPTGPLLEAVLKRAVSCGVERGSLDVLVQDESSRLVGGLRGKELSVQTRFGPANVPFADVAMVLGGAGVERSAQVHLRNGEVLAGPVTWKDVGFVTEAGLDVPLSPEQLNVLFLRAGPKDGVPPAGAAVLVSTHYGDRLAVPAKGPSRLQAATAWGPIDVGLTEIECLYLLRDPQPVYRLVLPGGSRLSVILRGGEAALPSLRFGEVKLAPASIAQVVQARPPRKPQEDQGDGPDEDEEGSKSPRVVLVGENTLAGTLQAAKIEVLTAAGPTQIETRLIRRMERREDDPEGGEFQIVLAEGSRIAGRLRDGVLAVQSQGKVWSVPLQHVVGFYQPLPSGPAKPEEAPEAGRGKPDAATPPAAEKPEAKPQKKPAEKPDADPFQEEPKPAEREC